MHARMGGHAINQLSTRTTRSRTAPANAADDLRPSLTAHHPVILVIGYLFSSLRSFVMSCHVLLGLQYNIALRKIEQLGPTKTFVYQLLTSNTNSKDCLAC